MKASAYYLVTGVSAAIAVCSTVLADYSAISPTLLGFVATSSAIVSLSVYFLNNKTSAENQQTLEHAVSKPVSSQTLEKSAAPMTDAVYTGKRNPFSFIVPIALNFKDVSRPQYSVPLQGIWDRVFISYNTALRPDWRRFVLYKEFDYALLDRGETTLDRNEVTQNLYVEFRNLLDMHSSENRSLVLLKQVERLEREIEKLAQQRLERSIKRAESALAREREEEKQSADLSESVEKPLLH